MTKLQEVSEVSPTITFNFVQPHIVNWQKSHFVEKFSI
jgi:hypothetical protein